MPGAQRILITGGNCGIGLEAAKQLLNKGHHVILACRDAGRAKKAVEALTPVAKANFATVESAQLDLASLASVRSGAEQILQRHSRLDVLLCNAGVMSSAGRGGPLQYTDDGYELTLQVNHLGHFLLVQLLMPALTASPAGRVVVVSSELHKKATAVAAAAGNTSAGQADEPPLASPDWLTRLRRTPAPHAPPRAAAAADAATTTAANADVNASGTDTGGSGNPTAPQHAPSGFELYCISKLYNLWFVYRLAELLPTHVTAAAVTPGWVPGTSLGRGVSWPARMVYQYVFPLIPFTVSVAEGARRVVAACVGEQERKATGRYYSRGRAAESSAESYDAAAAAALWKLSDDAVGVAAAAAVLREK